MIENRIVHLIFCEPEIVILAHVYAKAYLTVYLHM